MDFETALANWLAMAQERIDRHFATHYPKVETPTLTVEPRRKRLCIVKAETSSRSVFAFIDLATGDILKPASWKAPAKHARGNLFDESGGLKNVDSYGPAYLR